MNNQKLRILLTGMLLWVIVLCAGYPVLAAVPPAFQLSLTHQIDVPAGMKAGDVTVQYRLTSVDDASMPEGTIGDSMLFSLTGAATKEIMFQFETEGYYTYRLEMTGVEGAVPENISATQEAYTLVIAAFTPEATASLYGADGEKYSSLYIRVAEPEKPSEPDRCPEPDPPASKDKTTATPDTKKTPTSTWKDTPAPASGSASGVSGVSTPKTGDSCRPENWIFLLCSAGICALLLGWRISRCRMHGGQY